ncbi:MAG: hypothetical protein LQ352_008267, partial [Teloschistes flavicans]
MSQDPNFTLINTANILRTPDSARLTRSRAASVSEEQTGGGSLPASSITASNIIGDQNEIQTTGNSPGAAVSRSSAKRTLSTRQEDRHDPMTRKNRMAQRAQKGWDTRRRRNAEAVLAPPVQTSHFAAGDGHVGVEVRTPANVGESTAIAAPNLEGSQTSENPQDRRMALDYILDAPAEPPSSTGSRLDGNSQTGSAAEDSILRAPAASSSTTAGDKSLSELIEEVRRRPGYPWNINQAPLSYPTAPGLPGNAGSPPHHVSDSTASIQNANTVPEQQQFTGNNAAPGPEKTETSNTGNS